MPRFIPLCLALAVSTAASAAPVPKVVLSAEQEAEFNALWDGEDDRRSAATRQYCRLIQQPDAAVAYLTRTVKPAKLDEKEAKQLIADLDSKDEATWQKAQRDLRLRDVRLAMSLTDAWKMAKTDEQKLRLGHAVVGFPAPSVDPKRAKLRLEIPKRKGEQGQLECMTDDSGSWIAQVSCTFDELVAHRKKHKVPTDENVVIAVAALERIGTPAAVKHLEALTDGHPDAWTTREATAALERRKRAAAKPEADLMKVWRRDLDKFTTVDTANEFLDRPKEAVAFFKKHLVPPKLTADGAKKLLARLLSDDKKEVREALHKLQVVDLALEMNLKDAFEELKTAEHRCRVAAAVSLWEVVPYGDITDDFDIDERSKEFDYKIGSTYSSGPKFSHYILWKKWREKAPDGVRRDDPRDHRHFDTLCRTRDEIPRDRWYHEESAVYILDAIGTDEAVAIIKEMATGHPDAGPTKAAKDVLQRRGK